MKFNFKEWEDKKVVMHCSTEKESRDFCRVMHEAGKRWYNGTSYLYRTGWSVLKEEICYNFNEDTYDCRSFYIEGEYKILEWSDYMSDFFTKSDLKSGDVIVRRNGDVEIVCLEIGVCILRNGYNRINDIEEDLTCKKDNFYDIIDVYRPMEPSHCQFTHTAYTKGEHIYHRKEEDPVEITLQEIAKLKGVSVDKIKIVF